MREHLSPGVVFGLRFFACLLLFSAAFWAFSLHEHLGAVQRAIASLSVGVQRLTGGQARVEDDNIIVRTMVMNVNHECTGVFVCVLLVSFILAYPASWSARALGLGIGIPLLLAVNVLRLATLARIVEFYPEAFFYLHEYVWQGIFTVFVLVGAIAWAEKSR